MRRLIAAAKARGCVPHVFDTLACQLRLETGRLGVYYGEKRLNGVDLVIPRIGASVTGFGLAVVRQFELMGVPALNASEAIARSRDKLRSLQLFPGAGLPIPRTVLVRRHADVATMLKRVGGLPAIAKLALGTHGIGVMLVTTLVETQTLLETFWKLGHDVVLLQEYIREASGSDLRVFVVGGRVVASMRRQAKAGEFRSNLHRGGQGMAVTLTPEVEAVALHAARTMGLEVAGVDLLESNRGPLVVEVNSSPGFEGLEAATGVDVAGAIIDRGLRLARGEVPTH